MKIENLFWINFLNKKYLKILFDFLMTERCYQLMLDLLEISGYIHDNQYDSFEMLQQLLRTETKLMMILCIEIREDIDGRNQRFLIDSP